MATEPLTMEPDSKWLRETRLKAGRGLREMARELGVSAPYLYDIEKGRRNCPREVLDAYLELEMEEDEP